MSDLDRTPPGAPLDRTMTAAALAEFGEGRMAYVRAMSSEDIARAFPQAPELRPGLQLFALLAADGSPIALADTRDTAIANAWANDLETVSVH